jgi:hypothetical protein
MPSRRWRDEFNAGRAAVRAAAAHGRSTASPRQPRAEPQFGQHQAAGSPAGSEAEILRSLVAELRDLGVASQARIAELEAQLTATHWRAARLAEALETPGARNVLLRMFHPDAHPNADDAQRAALTEAAAKINAAYDLIDRAKGAKP